VGENNTMDMKGRRVKRSRIRGGKKRFRKLYEEMERKAIRFVLPEFMRKPRKVRSGAPEAIGWAYISLGFQYARGQCSRISNLGPISKIFLHMFQYALNQCSRKSFQYFMAALFHFDQRIT
jgi:hypothetical protein